MDGEHDQQASPGYVGPQGVPDTSNDDDEGKSTLAQIGEGIKDAFTGDDVAQAAEQSPEDVPMDINFHEAQDIGMAPADVENNPYQGSAGSVGLAAAKDEEPGPGDMGL